MSKLKKLSKFLPILGIALFLWILKGLGREGMMNILSILKNANLPLFISAAAFGFFVMLIKAWKWQLIVGIIHRMAYRFRSEHSDSWKSRGFLQGSICAESQQ